MMSAHAAGLNWNRAGHTWTAEHPTSEGTRYYTVEDFPGHGQAHLMVSLDEFPVDHGEYTDKVFANPEEARAAAELVHGLHFVQSGDGYEAMDDEAVELLRREAFRLAAAARRQAAEAARTMRATWGDTVADYMRNKDKTPPPAAPRGKPNVVKRDDIRLWQPEDSGLEYPVIAKYDPAHDSWEVLKQFDPPRKPKNG